MIRAHAMTTLLVATSPSSNLGTMTSSITQRITMLDATVHKANTKAPLTAMVNSLRCIPARMRMNRAYVRTRAHPRCRPASPSASPCIGTFLPGSQRIGRFAPFHSADFPVSIGKADRTVSAEPPLSARPPATSFGRARGSGSECHTHLCTLCSWSDWSAIAAGVCGVRRR